MNCELPTADRQLPQSGHPDPEAAASEFQATIEQLRQAVATVIVGQTDIIEQVLISAVCGGHVLLEGLPGLGKTALVHAVAQACDLRFRRIQFTPDLLPADLLGSEILDMQEGRRGFAFQQGPVFCNVLLADEINRATPKTQSALLECMQEGQVTVGNHSHPLPRPFFVLATQNPVEMDGTFPLPEAQLDRFFMKLLITLPNHDEFAAILDRTTAGQQARVEPVCDAEQFLALGRTLRQVPVAKPVQDQLIRLVRASHPDNPDAPERVRRYVRYGASPRAAQSLLLAARARALLHGRLHVASEDILALARPCLRHRIILGFEGEAEGISTDRIIEDLIA
ncbi:MAG: AAA family ATPase [Planctomycetota bacterium]